MLTHGFTDRAMHLGIGGEWEFFPLVPQSIILCEGTCLSVREGPGDLMALHLLWTSWPPAFSSLTLFWSELQITPHIGLFLLFKVA